MGRSGWEGNDGKGNDGKGHDCQRTTLLRMRPPSNSEPKLGILETGNEETEKRETMKLLTWTLLETSTMRHIPSRRLNLKRDSAEVYYDYIMKNVSKANVRQDALKQIVTSRRHPYTRRNSRKAFRSCQYCL